MCAALAIVMTNSGYIIDTAAADEPTFVVTTSKSTVDPGDYVTVTVSAANNTGLNAWKVALEYSNTVFDVLETGTYQDIDDYDDDGNPIYGEDTHTGFSDPEGNEYDFFAKTKFKKGSAAGPNVDDKKTMISPITFNWQYGNGNAVKSNGVMFEVYLKVKDDAPAGEYVIDLSYDSGDIIINDADNVGQSIEVPFNKQSATITVNGAKVDPTSVTADSPITLTSKGATKKITPTVLPANASDKAVAYTSSDPKVATVADDGTVTAVADGDAVITVYLKNYPKIKTTVDVKVDTKVAVTSVTASPAKLTFTNKTSQKITPTVLPENASDKTVTYTSGDTKVATVDDNGNVTPVANGTTTITVASKADPTKKAAVEVEVKLPVLPTAIDASNISFASKDDAAKKISYSVTPDNADDKSVSFAVKDSSIATVDNEGNVTPKGEGTTTVTITSNADKSVTKTITVSVAHKHNLTKVPAEEATWKEEGNKEYYTCDGCDELFLDAEGTKTTTLEEVTIPVKETKIINAKEATCEDDGYTGDRVLVEDETVVCEEGKVINKLGHDWGEPEYTWNDDHTECKAKRVCKRDKTHEDVQTSVSVSSEVTKQPECEAKGETTYTAKFAEDTGIKATSVTVEDINALEHDYDFENAAYKWVKNEGGYDYTATVDCKNGPHHIEVKADVEAKTSKDAKCGEPGEVTYTATFKDDRLKGAEKTEKTDALEHNWSDWTIVEEATYEKEGTRTRTCSRCNTVEAEKYSKMLVATEVKAVEPTCEEPGNIAYYVRDDNDPELNDKLFKDALCTQPITLEETVIKATGHDYAEIEYTWSEDNKTCTAVKACKNDEKHNIVEKAEAVEKVTKEATCGEKGEKVFEVH